MQTGVADRPATAGPALVDVKWVAAALGCSPRHVTRLAAAGLLPAPTKLGALVRWDRTKFQQWIAAGCPAVRPQP